MSLPIPHRWLLQQPSGAPTLAQQLLTNHYIGWHLDEESGSRVSHGLADKPLAPNTGSIGSAAGVSAGTGNAALFVSATGNRLQRVNEDALQLGDTIYTIRLWVYLETKAVNMYIHTKGVGATDEEFGFLYVTATDAFRFTVRNGGTELASVVTPNNSAPLQGWAMLCGYHDSVNNEIGIALNDGDWITAATSGPASVNTRQVCVGAGGSSSPQDGRADEIDWWKNEILSDELRAGLYNNGDGLAYPFDV